MARFKIATRAGCSGDLPPPSPPAEKATARQDQAVNKKRALAECPLQRKRIIRSFAKA